jgi:anti-sigma28 factor (negative regulator of flagellin synthesis)
MDIRNSLDGLKSLLGVTPAAPPAIQPRAGGSSGATTVGSLGSDQATVSSAGSEVSQTASEPADRTEKIVGIQAALASGNYSVPPAAVAVKVVDALLNQG